MPTVTVNLYASFREHIGGEASVVVEIQAGNTVEQLLVTLGVPVEQARIIFCNNRLVDLTHQLKGTEVLGIFPAIGGG